MDRNDYYGGDSASLNLAQVCGPHSDHGISRMIEGWALSRSREARWRIRCRYGATAQRRGKEEVSANSGSSPVRVVLSPAMQLSRPAAERCGGQVWVAEYTGCQQLRSGFPGCWSLRLQPYLICGRSLGEPVRLTSLTGALSPYTSKPLPPSRPSHALSSLVHLY